MKTIKFLAVFFVISSIALATFADTIVDSINPDSTITLVKDSVEVVSEKPSVFQEVFTFNNIIIILVGLYEILLRVYPTAKNYSILSMIYKVLNFLVPNKKKDGGTHS